MSFRHALPIFLILTLGLAACSGEDAEQAENGSPEGGALAPPTVEVIQARNGSLPLEERLSGTVRADNQVAIFAEISEPIVEVLVENGDAVQRGQALVRLKGTQYREQVSQAEAALRITEAEAKRAQAAVRELQARLNRTETLAEKQYQSAQELEVLRAQVAAAEATYEQAEARVAQAQATLEERKADLSGTVVRAPISGRVGQRNAEVGMRVDGSARLFTIGNFDVVRVRVAITDEMFGRIEEGQTALITSESLPDTMIAAEVSRISPFLDAGSYSAQVDIDVPNDDGVLRPGMFVTVDVLYGESEQATIVPASALYEDPRSGKLGVFVAPSLGTEVPMVQPETYEKNNPPPLSEPTQTMFREVEVVARGRELAGIRGVDAGTWVVTVGQNLLQQAGTERVQARVRAVPWDRILALQRLQDQDFLRAFMEKQQRLAREQFAQPGAARGEAPADSQRSLRRAAM